ncbi:alpha-glucosidase [Hordeum vulgare]|nr:alpha-glucosidase [Hordeum vulgare]
MHVEPSPKGELGLVLSPVPVGSKMPSGRSSPDHHHPHQQQAAAAAMEELAAGSRRQHCFICSEFQDIFDVDCAIASLRGDLKAERIDSILPVSWWGYHNLLVVEDVVENYQSAQIPLDVIWNYDDHMDARKDFTLSPMNYPRPKLLAFLDMLQFLEAQV